MAAEGAGLSVSWKKSADRGPWRQCGRLGRKDRGGCMGSADGSRELEAVRAAEAVSGQVRKSRHYPLFHVAPPVGWLNDPNGLCQFQGMYHAFFQYAPFDAAGGLKFWGHSVSRDLLHWQYAGAALAPDRDFDRDGVYSGCALTEGERLRLYYTGNVKQQGEYDYIRDGREANVVMVEAAAAKEEPGALAFGEKRLLFGTADYPPGLTRHIRDPKVWKEEGGYYMVLGGRKETDEGCVLVYRSPDGGDWEYEGEIGSREPFGYMWECPDLFPLPEAGVRILSVSPQGLKRETHRYQNVYASGYFQLPENAGVTGEVKLDPASFREWDQGFDFYAPQTFQDEKGRRILIAWMGLPDVETEYTVPTLQEGWQHILTVPRQLTARDGRLYCYPVEETLDLHREELPVQRTGKEPYMPDAPEAGTCPCLCDRYEMEGKGSAYDLFLTGVCTEKSPLRLQLAEGLTFTFQNGEAVLAFTGEEGRRLGAGRGVRRARLQDLRQIRVLADASSLEIFLNEGECTFTTRFFPSCDHIKISAHGAIGRVRCYLCC